MGLLDRRAWRLIVIGGLQIALGTVAVTSLGLMVQPSPIRDAVILVMWPLVIIAGTVIAWRWLGRLERGEGWMALTEVIESGRELRRRLTDIPTDPLPGDNPEASWDVRVKDWASSANAVVEQVAPERIGAFKTDVLWVDVPENRGDHPKWVVGHLTEVDWLLERLVIIRASL